jgi:hypothetical protein
MSDKQTWLAALQILVENAVGVLPKDLSVDSQEIAQAIVQGAVKTGRISPDDLQVRESTQDV